MQRVILTFLFGSLILGACSTRVASPPALPSSPTIAPLPTTAIPNPKFIVTVGTPHIDQPAEPAVEEVTPVSPKPQDCGYQWANQDLPELSSSFEQSVQELQPKAQASAYAFGENCIRADGTVADFTAMETDFNVSLQVDDLANESVLGKWIVQVMQIIENIPADQIASPRPGRVSIVFQSSTAQTVINFYINQYQELPAALNYAEIYESLKALQ